jgi:hypothetical protein
MHVWCFNNHKEKPLSWSGGPLYENANFCPCWSYAQDQLPLFSAACLTPTTTFSPTLSHMRTFAVMDDINMPNFSSVGHSTHIMDTEVKLQMPHSVVCKIKFEILLNM